MNTHPTAALRGARRRLVTRRPWLTDLALGGGLTAFDVLTLLSREPAPGPVGVLLWGLQTVPLVWRRRRPRAVLCAMTAAFVAFEVVDPVPGKIPGPYLLVFAVYAVARHTPVRAGLPWTVLSLLTAVTTDLLTGRTGPPQAGSVEPVTATTFVVFYGAAWLVGYGRRRIVRQADRLRDLNLRLGDANGQLQDVNARLRDANERLRAEREINARQAVVAERARIARDLHDVVAHHVSAIAVQARATEEVLPDAPPDGRRGVARIAETADTALVEMRRILGLLAAGPERDDGSGLPPEPSLRHLDRLFAAAGAAGCRVTTALDETLGELPPALQVSAYRIVQEALTNVLKHAGPTDVRVALRLDGPALTVAVENGPPTAGHRPPPGSGRGLLGIRERVAAFGGAVRTGPHPHGGWRLSATLPLEAPV
ncbi:two-component sensor histidine kinase [Streptomyces sp. CB02959]|uniref:sensor histidine kinase n=1 Tax=Streptomyces sp. CB02959 TaxID=2020330 RepID=UPI000C27C584|nr:sensor histidine kinase [Streptomyces sp. CB02959]PJN39137.1 two-component sensor histidine kinase [Streptomyces sp. CB02959]